MTNSHRSYCFTELATGGDLCSFLASRGCYGPPLNEGDVKMIMRQIADGVAFLHRSGVVHRDLKPENILFSIRPSPDYRLVITDLGQVGLAHARLTSVVGTERYNAP